MNELDNGAIPLHEHAPIPAWFRKEHPIQVLPDTGFDFYSDENEIGILQTDSPGVAFVPQEAAFLFGDSPSPLFFRVNFSTVIKVDAPKGGKEAMQEKLYNMPTGVFCDYSGPTPKTIHGITVYHDALDLIPTDSPQDIDLPVDGKEIPGHLLFPIQFEDNDDNQEAQSDLIPRGKISVEDEIQMAIASEIEQGHGEVLGRYAMSENEYFPYDLVLMSNRLLVIVHGALSEDWLAEEEPFADEPPLWFSEVDHLPSPAYQAQKCRGLFERDIPGLLVSAIVVLPQNTFILNEDEMGAEWKDKCRVHMVRTQKNPNSELLSLHDCLASLPDEMVSPSAHDIEAMHTLAKSLVSKSIDWNQM